MAFVTRPSNASGPLGAQGAPITTSDYRLDLFQGPVLAGSRLTGLGGAYQAVADGAEGHFFNPAAAAVRSPWVTTKFDGDVNGSLIFPSSIGNTDFDNNGSVGFAQKNFVFATLGANVNYGSFGIGVSLSAQDYNLEASSTNEALELSLVTAHLVTGYGFFKDQVQMGVGVRFVNLSVRRAVAGSASSDVFDSSGAGLETGVIVAPHDRPFRASVAFRTAVTGKLSEDNSVKPNAAGDLVLQGKYLPHEVRLPAEIEMGFAYQFGRPLNPGWVDEDELDPKSVEAASGPLGIPGGRREVAHRLAKTHYVKLPRDKLLVAASLLLTAPTTGGVGTEGVLRQTVDRSGGTWSVSPRLGVEGEPITNRLEIRAGTYLEPSRFAYSSSRLHGTLGADLKVLEWTLFGLFPPGTEWRISGVVDGSRKYFGSGFSFGVWH